MPRQVNETRQTSLTEFVNVPDSPVRKKPAGWQAMYC